MKPWSRQAPRTQPGALSPLAAEGRRFRRADGGQIAILFGLASTAILLAAGSGMDLSRAYSARQKLSEVAVLACQYASRPVIAQTASQNNGATYTSSVNSYITAALSTQQFGLTQGTASPFTFIQNGAANVNLTANVPTAFMQIAGVTQMPIAATSHCYDTPPVTSPYLIQEGFEASACTGTCSNFYGIPGRSLSTSTSSFTATPVYTGASGATWNGTGYCLQTSAVGVTNVSVPEGSHAAELDCSNSSGTAGNSAISSKVYMAAGNYELRYFYRGRVSYPDYDPAYICGTTAADVSWANSTRSSGGPVSNALRSNQMNVYLDPNTSGSPPLHTTLDAAQQLAGSNLIDVCVYSSTWIERSVKITVTTSGDHWLTFAADGQNDTSGAQLDNVRLCTTSCPGTVADNFPDSWQAANNGGVNKLLFRDTFESPNYSVYNCGGGSVCATNGNLNLSLGTSGTASSGWPSQLPSGWATAPYNQVDYNLVGAVEGDQTIDLDGSQSGSQTTSNRLTSRPFVLDPGYYNVKYYYRSAVGLSGISGVYCGTTPAAAGLNVAAPAGYDTNFIAVFMAHSQLVSYPNGGGALYSTTTYTNPNGSTSTTPTVAPNSINFTSFNASQPNALLDLCGYGASWQSRSVNFLITKPGTYWLTVSALGQADNQGGQVDDVRLTALGSPYMGVPPSNPVTIPVPNPQPNGQVTYSSFNIVADPLRP